MLVTRGCTLAPATPFLVTIAHPLTDGTRQWEYRVLANIPLRLASRFLHAPGMLHVLQEGHDDASMGFRKVWLKLLCMQSQGAHPCLLSAHPPLCPVRERGWCQVLGMKVGSAGMDALFDRRQDPLSPGASTLQHGMVAPLWRAVKPNILRMPMWSCRDIILALVAEAVARPAVMATILMSSLNWCPRLVPSHPFLVTLLHMMILGTCCL